MSKWTCSLHTNALCVTSSSMLQHCNYKPGDNSVSCWSHCLFHELKTECRLFSVVNQCDWEDHFSCSQWHRDSVCADSPVCSATGWWMDKTKDQINSFGPGLIARWESKLFSLFFFLNIGPDQTFNIAPASRVRHSRTPASVEWTKALPPLAVLCLPVNPDNSIFQYSSLQTGENLMKSQCLN